MRVTSRHRATIEHADLNHSTSTCDYLVIGGGSAGSIVARRLADANIGDVVLLEAGPNDRYNPSICELARLDEQNETTEWGFKAWPHSSATRPIEYARAKMLGGCGGHNDCAFLIPPPEDFVPWRSHCGERWSVENIARHFARVDSMVHTDEDPPIGAVSQAFLDAGAELDLAFNNFRKTIDEGVGAFPLNCLDGTRQSASIAYLHNTKKLPDNLVVKTNTLATHLLFDNNRAKGCETDRGEFVARREVILACGAVQTPQLLMVSGIGDTATLLNAGVKPHIALPGVGQNLLDHAAANIVLELSAASSEWELTPCEVTVLLRSDAREMTPDLLYHFVLRLREKYASNSGDFASANGVKISPNVARPRSRGQLLIEGPDITHPPRIELNYFSDADGEDMRKMLHGLRYARRFEHTRAFAALGAKELLPGPSVRSDAALVQYVLDTCETVYHPAGTCRMGRADDPLAVVNSEFAVLQTEGLRAVDASVFPDLISVNINNTVMMVAESAAEVIISSALTDDT
ncbi:MAG: GMC family oxidoreductase [Pseudomonadota bacterium]